MTQPTKRFKTLLTNVQTALAGLAIWQTLTDTATTAAAAEKIYFWAARDDEPREVPPRIVLDIERVGGRYGGNRFQTVAEVLALMELSVPHDKESEADQADWVWSQLETWFDELEAGVGSAGQLNLLNIELDAPPGVLEDPPDIWENMTVWICQFRLEIPV
jgi:hypothetical protein